MNIYKKTGLIAGQVFMGLAFAMLGVITQVVVVHLVSVTRGTYVDTFGTIMSSWIGCLCGFLVGIGLDGFRFLKKEGRHNDFLKFLLLSVLGTCGGFLGLYSIMSDFGTFKLPTPLMVIVLGLPFTGILLGTILVLARDDKRAV
jgi:hypothetical protein